MQEFDINDFQCLEYYPEQITRFPEITINTDAIHFNVATLKKLGSPPSIKLMFDPDGRRIAIQGFSKKGNKTIDLPAERKSRDFGIHRREKVQFIRGLMPEWDVSTRFKVKGDFYEKENVIVYDLKTAAVFEGACRPATRHESP